MSLSLPFSTLRSRVELGWAVLVLTWLAGIVFAWQEAPLGDEWVHWHQIDRFLRGDHRVYREYLTNIPGLHWLTTGLLLLFGGDSLPQARAVCACYSLAAVAVFAAIRLRLHPHDLQRAVAQFFFLPILFPLWFLVYTDPLSLGLVLAGLLAAQRGRHGWAAIALLASIAIRQNNVLWAAFVALLVLQPLWRACGWRIWKTLPQSLAIAWPYALVGLAFLAYWAWNGSISYSNAQGQTIHPDLHWGLGNPFFMLFLTALLFPLHTAIGLRRYVAQARGRPWLWAMPMLIFALFAWGFAVDHPFNDTVKGLFYLRNSLLRLITAEAWAWAGFGVAATLAACSLVQTRWLVPGAGWLLPFAVCFVGASWLIEQRYALIPFALLMALRQPEAAWVERLTLGFWVVLSIYLTVGVYDQHFLL